MSFHALLLYIFHIQGINRVSNSYVSIGRIVRPIWGGVALGLHLNLPYLSGAVIMLSAFFLSFAEISGEKSGAGL